MNRNIVETVMGAVVLIIAGVFLVFAYRSAQINTVSGYEVTATFNHAEGIHTGGDVRISGIKVGTILSETLDPKTFQANVRMSIDNAIKLPSDTVAMITASGLLGDNFMALVPGADDDHPIPPNGKIVHAQSPTSIMDLFSQAAFSMTNGGAKPGDPNAAKPADPNAAAPAKP
ncbi:MAG TPA: outer membrane lipid asymmetry maintenance protein MlaD [Aliidongia sp.]|nr:outer membrane lipid asymmetry maintenance protein MlaD [Aliidongia sp.]